MIDLTPLDVRKKKGDFRRALRGYEPALVDDFLDIVADRLEELVREHASLTERVSRLEHQVSEYRDRERALTDALVTAQAMREEITERTTREAAAVRLTAQQEAETQLKDAVQQADTTVRDAEQRAQEQLRRAHEEAETRLQRAQQDASTRLREAEEQASARLQGAEEEATSRLRAAEQEAERLRAAAETARAEEEETLRQLRARQEELVTSYRTFLQRELMELNTMAASLQPGAADPVDPVGDVPAPPVGDVPDPPVGDVPAPPIAGAAAMVAAAAEDSPLPGPAEDVAPAEFVPETFAAALPSGDEEEEPFAPEPVYDEDLEEDERITRIKPVDLLRLDSPEVSEESGEAVEESWPDLDILPEGQEPDFSRPQPNPEALQLPWPDEATSGAADADDAVIEDGDADPETEALLENAARAGYSLDLDDEAELLLDEPATGEGESDDWLDSIIEDDR